MGCLGLHTVDAIALADSINLHEERPRYLRGPDFDLAEKLGTD